MNATKERFGADDLDSVFEGMTKVVVAKGKRSHVFDLKQGPPDPAEFQKLVLGPTGNLRAPTFKKGKTAFVGFSADAYDEYF